MSKPILLPSDWNKDLVPPNVMSFINPTDNWEDRITEWDEWTGRIEDPPVGPSVAIIPGTKEETCQIATWNGSYMSSTEYV